MGEFGLRLRQARERAGLSLPEISARTKIRESLLEAIEREEFERLPAGLLTRGHLRAYSREVGLDPEIIVHQYRMQFEPATPPSASVRPPDRSASGQVTEWRMGLAPFAVIVLTAVVAMLIVYPGDDAEAPEAMVSEPVATLGDEEGRPSDGRREPLASEDVTQRIDVRRASGLTLEIHPTGPVWVEATADGKRVLYQLVNAGERRRLEALDELLVRIGDAGAFRYTINGERGRSLGGPSQVRDIRITRDNVMTFLDR